MLRCARGRPAAVAATASALALLRWHACMGDGNLASEGQGDLMCSWASCGSRYAGCQAMAGEECGWTGAAGRCQACMRASCSLIHRSTLQVAVRHTHLEQASCLAQVGAAVGQQEELEAGAVQQRQPVCR